MAQVAYGHVAARFGGNVGFDFARWAADNRVELRFAALDREIDVERILLAAPSTVCRWLGAHAALVD